MKKITLLVMVLTIFSKVFGFGRDIVLSYFYGASYISDAYLISITIPLTIFSIIGVGISTGYIPIYSDIIKKYGHIQGNKYTNNLINLLVIVCTLIILFSLIFTNQIVKAFAAGFDKRTLELAVQFTRISLIGIYFSGIIYIFNGFLQVNGNFAIPALVGLPLNFFTILAIYFSTKTNILVLSIVSTVAIASQLLLLIPFILKKGYKYEFSFNLKDKNIIKMTYIALPAIVGVSVSQINVLVDRTLASTLVVGGISSLNYANRLIAFVVGIFIAPIITVVYPIISNMTSVDDIHGLKKYLSEAIRGMNLLVIPSTVGCMIFSQPIVEILFGRGAFDSKAISMTALTLSFYSIGLIGLGLRELLSRTFYTFHDTKTPMINAVIAVVLNIILNIILSKFLGIGGLALATSISAIFCTLLLFVSLRKKIGPFGMKNITISFIKILCASLVMGLITKLTFNFLRIYISQNLSLVISIGLGATIYFTIIYFMKINDVDVIVNAIKRKIKRV